MTGRFVFVRNSLSVAALVASLCGCLTFPGQNEGPVTPAPARPPVASPKPSVTPQKIVMPSNQPPAIVPRADKVVKKDPSAGISNIWTVQIILDRQNYSPGCLDGRAGPNTCTALKIWQEQHNLALTGVPDEPTLALLGQTNNLFTNHVVTTNDLVAIAPAPPSWAEKSKVKFLGYTTLLDYIAEKYHARKSAVKLLNPTVSWPNPPVGTSVVVPNPFPNASGHAAHIAISLSEKNVRVYDEKDRLIAVFPCSIARDVSKRPVGVLSVVNCAANPNYVFDPDLFSEDPAAARAGGKLLIPPGPRNPVGTTWISLNQPGYGIHGTPHPEDIGKTESHGCFRLANWNAAKLLKMISIGIPVEVSP